MRLLNHILAIALLLALSAPAFACPMCKDSVGNDDATATAATGPGGSMGGPASGLPGGFNTSVYIMLLGLFGTMGLVGWTVVKGIRGGPPHPRGFPITTRPAAPSERD